MSDLSLRAALENLAEWLLDEDKHGVPSSVVDAPEAFEFASSRLLDLLREHPAEPVGVVDYSTHLAGGPNCPQPCPDHGGAVGVSDEAVEASHELRELVDMWKMLTEKPPIDEFDRGVRAARLEVIDAVLALMGGAGS